MNKGLEKPCFMEVCYYLMKADLSRRWLTVRSTVYKETGSQLPFFGPQSTSLSERADPVGVVRDHLQASHVQQLGLGETKYFRKEYRCGTKRKGQHKLGLNKEENATGLYFPLHFPVLTVTVLFCLFC